MENSQSVQDELIQVTEARPKWTNTKSRLTNSSSNIVIYLVTHHPWLLLTGLLTMFIGSTALALYSLGHVGGAEQIEPEEISAVVERPIKTPSQSNPTPLWMVAAIALSCGSGCFIVLRLLNRPTQPRRKSRKRINRYPEPLTPKPHQNWEPKTLSTPPVFVPTQPLKPIVSMPKTKPLVTVLPPEHRHPLDKKSKESLADLMDIRKQNSLSAILRSS